MTVLGLLKSLGFGSLGLGTLVISPGFFGLGNLGLGILFGPVLNISPKTFGLFLNLSILRYRLLLFDLIQKKIDDLENLNFS